MPDLHANRLAVPALVGTFGIQTLAATAMFGVSVVAPAAAPDIGVEATHVGTFTAIAYGSGLVAGLIAGALADRYGAIRVSQLTMIFAFLACCFFAFGTPWAAFASAIALGLCYGPVNPASTHILARVVPERSRPLYFSIKQTGMPAGAALAGATLPTLVDQFGWQTAILVAGGAAVLIGICVQPLRQPIDRQRDSEREIKFGSLWTPLSVVWHASRLRSLAFMGFVYSGSQVTIMTLYVVYLTSELTMSLTLAGVIYMVLQISAVVGRLFWGAIGDRLVASRKLLVLIGLGSAVFCALSGFYSIEWPIWAIASVSFLLGITTSGWNGLFFSELVKHAPKGKTGEAAGGLQFATLSGVMIFPAVFGVLIGLFDSYLMAFSLLAGVIALAALQFAASFAKEYA